MKSGVIGGLLVQQRPNYGTGYGRFQPVVIDMANVGRLPKFSAPPLDEVVLGVQFKKPEHYHQLYASDVWKLFREEFPKLQVHRPLAPSFETFGVSSSGPSISVEPVEAGIHDRFWFMSANEAELLQFQEDRFISNWRKREGVAYPHFEAISANFYRNFDLLSGYFSSEKLGEINVNQAEISYINVIRSESGLSCNDALKFIDSSLFSFEGFSFRAGERIVAAEKPIGRIIVEAQSVTVRSSGQPGIRFSLSVRGAPIGPTRSDVEDFLEFGRELIVKRFVELTTDSFQRIWGKLENGDDS